jgi:hypothetical protein
MGAPRVTLNAFLERSKAIHGDKYDYSKVDWINTRIKVEIICPIHGSFYQKPFKHLQGQGCPNCRKNADVTQDIFIERAKRIHGDKYDYSCVQYQTMWTPVEIICPIHGSFFQPPAKHVKTGRHAAQGCPKCRYIRQRETLKNRYGVDNPMRKKEFADTNWEMKKRNGTCSSSQPEEQMYKELVEIFGKKAVKRNYNKDERYPFYCDFYIVTHDIFIELNGTWFHGRHFFNENNEKDVEMLHVWESRLKEGHFAYSDAIYRWTVMDPLKRETAEKNGLNYFVFWDNDLTDFHIWLQNYNYTETKHII